MPSFVLRLNFARFVVILLLASGAAELAAAAPNPTAEKWQPVQVPQVWEGQKPFQPQRAYAWYRCAIVVPESWRERALQIFVEPLDDARQIFWNEQLVATSGALPPTYRSGLGTADRHPLPRAAIRFGATNVLSLRVYRNDSRSGFNAAAPALFAGEDAVRLNGPWEARLGDDVVWAADPKLPGSAPFREIQPATQAERALKQLSNEDGPLSPAATLAKLQTAPDLKLDLVLSEPEIGQPVSFKFDPRGRLWVCEYLQYPSPAGLTMVSRDMFLRTVYDRLPAPPPHHFPGRDKISIHADSDGNGTLDRHTTFVEGLSMVSSFAFGDGGLWVLNPPYLLFYPDRNGDDRPDSDPEVHLEGFGLEDTHSIANSLRWGPDGWLYGAQGSTVSGQIKRPGSSDPPQRSVGQLIWRYHPRSHRYEVFAEGGGNTFGIEIDSQGRIYSGHNGGNTRGFHYVQGGYYLKGFGKHGELSNPYAYGYFNAMAHQDVPRFTHTFIIYEATNLPPYYRGKLWGVEPLQGRVVLSELSPDGSSFKSRDLSHPLTSQDSWVRPVDIQVGPDGAVYVADFYEQRIDHASHYQGRVHRESGRIYRLQATNAPKATPFNLAALPTGTLLDYLRHENKWFRQTALFLLDFRSDHKVIPALEKMLADETGQTALEALWALNLTGGLTEAVADRALQHSNPSVRAWTVRLLCDENQVSEKIGARLEQMGRTEPVVEVRSQLASSAGRLSAPLSLSIVRRLLDHSNDRTDLHLPLLLWWALESKITTDRAGVLALARDPAVWHGAFFQEHIASRLMRRFAASGTRADLLTCVELFHLATGEEEQRRLIKGLEQAYAGRPMTGLPAELSNALADAGGLSLVTAVRQGKAEAVASALEKIPSDKADSTERVQLMEALSEIHDERAVPPLLRIVESSRDDAARKVALGALGHFAQPEIGARVTSLQQGLPPGLREAAQALLATRPSWTLTFLQAVTTNKIDPLTVSLAAQQKFRLHHQPAIDQLLQALWKEEPSGTDDKEVGRLTALTETGSGNPYLGKALYGQLCATCHTLFGQGGQVGPDLTPYQRFDTRGLIMNIVRPSAEIRTGYENYLITTKDERVLTGFLAEQDARMVVMRALDGQNLPVPREEILSLRALPLSVMPEGLLASLPDQSIRDLLAYLRGSQPLPE